MRQHFFSQFLNRSQRHWLALLTIALLTSLTVAITLFASALSRSQPQVHPLPPTLARWQVTDAGDYFDQIKPNRVGYLVWSEFPVTVYVDPPTAQATSAAEMARSQAWDDAVLQAIADWQPYLPLQIVTQPLDADITILRSTPPLQLESGNKPGAKVSLGRVRAAETRFELYEKSGRSQPILSHRFKILLSPNQAAPYTLATARHEIGHALGIWGHSPLPTDALYFAQVANPPRLSARDINTLKRIYQQPTQLGWALP